MQLTDEVINNPLLEKLILYKNPHYIQFFYDVKNDAPTMINDEYLAYNATYRNGVNAVEVFCRLDHQKPGIMKELEEKQNGKINTNGDDLLGAFAVNVGYEVMDLEISEREREQIFRKSEAILKTNNIDPDAVVDEVHYWQEPWAKKEGYSMYKNETKKELLNALSKKSTYTILKHLNNINVDSDENDMVFDCILRISLYTEGHFSPRYIQKIYNRLKNKYRNRKRCILETYIIGKVTAMIIEKNT